MIEHGTVVAQRDDQADNAPSDSLGSHVFQKGQRLRLASDELTLATSTTSTSLRTAEETWFEDYCDGIDLSNDPSSPKASPLESERKTIDLPIPRSRHRRNKSAVPRLQSSPGERPPLPPKKFSISSTGSVQSPRTSTSLRKDAISWESAGWNSPLQRPSSKITKPGHRRNASTSCLTLPKPSPLDDYFVDLVMLQQKFGTQDSRVAAIWNKIGNYHVRDSDFEAAVEAYNEAIKCEPGEHLADSYGNMGSVLFKLGKVDESVHYFKNALIVREYNLMSEGKDPKCSLNIATLQYQIGLAQTLRKRYDEAWQALRGACEIQAIVLGEKHADMAKTLDAIGKVYLLRNNHKAALACHEEALSIKKGLSGGHDAKTRSLLTTMQNIAVVHKAGVDLDTTICAYGAVLRAQKQLMGSGHESVKAQTAETLVVLADLYKERGMDQKANSYLMEADHILEQLECI